MKSPLRKFRGFAMHKGEAREKRNRLTFNRIDELAQATQDMEDMRNCYDSLLVAAAATTNAAYEFSERLGELGDCLLEKTALNDDEDSGRVLLMLGKGQYQIQKFIDSYRSHISKTIISPSQSLLSELQTVEEMKYQCDVKRNAYEHVLASQGVKGKPRNARENIPPQNLQAALDEYEDEANLFIFRLKSLKQGQSRSLLTQAVRHHAAQMNFFKKACGFLESVEPHVKVITEQQHIDYQFSGLEDDDGDGDGDGDGYDVNDDGELSSDFEQPQQATVTISAERRSMELDQADHTFAPPLSTDITLGNQVNVNAQGDSYALINDPKDVSHSASILDYYDKKIDTVENFRDIKLSTSRKFSTYILPTPGDTKNTMPATSNMVPGRQASVNGQTNTLFHSLPLAPIKSTGGYVANQSLERPHMSKSHSVLKESNMNSLGGWASIHLGEGLSLRKSDWRSFSDNKKVKRQAFSGPLTDKPWSSKSTSSAAGPAASLEHSLLVSKLFTRMPVPSQEAVSSKVSPCSSPPLISSPKISELHVLPRPPSGLAKNVSSKTSLITHSAPLASRSQQRSLAEKSMTPRETSPLPRPPGTVPRSFSIPSRGGQRAQLRDCIEPPPVDFNVDAASPPLTPIAFPNSQPSLAAEVRSSKPTDEE